MAQKGSSSSSSSNSLRRKITHTERKREKERERERGREGEREREREITEQNTINLYAKRTTRADYTINPYCSPLIQNAIPPSSPLLHAISCNITYKEPVRICQHLLLTSRNERGSRRRRRRRKRNDKILTSNNKTLHIRHPPRSHPPNPLPTLVSCRRRRRILLLTPLRRRSHRPIQPRNQRRPLTPRVQKPPHLTLIQPAVFLRRHHARELFQRGGTGDPRDAGGAVGGEGGLVLQC